MAHLATQAYKTTKVKTANQKTLILMLYDGAITSLRSALDLMVKGEGHSQETIHKYLVKSQDIITELMTSLDMEKGGEIAQNLFNLYDFFFNEISQANIKKEPGNLKEVLKFLEELKEAWEQVKESEVPSQSGDVKGVQILT